MKYTRLFNNYNEYAAYSASTSFIRPNVSYCIQEDRSYCTPIGNCKDSSEYEVIGEPYYPSVIQSSAMSFVMEFQYERVHTLVTCEVVVSTATTAVTISVGGNPSETPRTISGIYNFHGIDIPYELEQEGKKELPYDEQYLTFDILSGGTLIWKAYGNGTKTISYSKNNELWSEITSTTTGITINVASGDTIMFKGANTSYATDKNNYSGFDGGTATFNVKGNIMSLIYGDNFVGESTMSGTYNFCQLFKNSKVESAENLILPSSTLTECCYRAMFSKSTLKKAPMLPAITLANSCYWYMFEDCGITEAPELLASTLVAGCYGYMFLNCNSLNYIKCLAASGFSSNNCKASWVSGVASSGTFIKDESVSAETWGSGASGIPTNWTVFDGIEVKKPLISYDGIDTITLSCETQGSDIYYRIDENDDFSAYSTPIVIDEDTIVEAYAEFEEQTSDIAVKTCIYVSDVPIEYSNRDLQTWQYNNQEITTPYSVNAIDGHSSSYAKGEFEFETNFGLRSAQPTYIWFQHADHSADVYIGDTKVETHWGGYNAFFVDVSNYVHSGSNEVKVILNNTTRTTLAPNSGDFNFNATLGNVKLYTSPCLPSMNYGYDGFHVTSTVSDASATINIKTTIPTGATVICKIDDGNTNIYSATSASTVEEMTFTKVIANPHLWNGTIDPHLYTITLEIYKNGDLYHRYTRPYGLRYYEYVIDDTEKVGTQSNPYTGFLLNGSPYLLRGVCMHDDLDGKANALDANDYAQEFSIIQELGCNFLRLAHYPHPKEVYDYCDRLGIIVQTEVPCVNKFESTMPNEYYQHLTIQYTDMVNQHYNHPCILFWGLSNEAKTNDASFTKSKVEEYRTLIKNLDQERWVGYVVHQGAGNPLIYYGSPDCDWYASNIYVGWYDQPTINTPTSQLNTRLSGVLTNAHKPFAFSEYGCGGTQNCHSETPQETTNKGSGGARHDIEYQMWLHEGHIATIKQYPQLLFSSQWQLFDVAVTSRNEGYTVCLDGENTSIDDNLRRLNNKGLVERDHVTKKDTFYLYKAWWNTDDKFVHICGKDYTKTSDRAIKCYSNDGSSFKLYKNNTLVETVTASDNIVLFTATNFESGDVVKVEGSTVSDTFTFD